MFELIEVGLTRVSDGDGGTMPVIHMSKKGLIPGTSSSRPLIEVAIWKREDDSEGCLLRAMGAAIGGPPVITTLIID